MQNRLDTLSKLKNSVVDQKKTLLQLEESTGITSSDKKVKGILKSPAKRMSEVDNNIFREDVKIFFPSKKSN